ncbi:hypothetical protein SALBM217S_10649 [Streptomyces griseoloalbus]
MAWLLVIVAGLLETGFAVCLKLSHGFTRLWPTVAFCAFALGSFGLLTWRCGSWTWDRRTRCRRASGRRGRPSTGWCSSVTWCPR